jgi:hypothetical protein
MITNQATLVYYIHTYQVAKFKIISDTKILRIDDYSAILQDAVSTYDVK